MVISDRSRIPRDVFDAIWNCAAVATDDEDLTPLSFDQIDKIVSQTLQARQLVIR